MRTIIIFLLLLTAIVIISGCAVLSPESSANETVLEETGSLETGNSPAAENLPAGACSGQWLCISSMTKAYRYDNCSIGQRSGCTLGCVNGTCKEASTCVSGFKCRNQLTAGYQTEGCSWIKETRCDWKCEQAECIPKPANATNETEEETISTTTVPAAPPPPPWYYLKVGEVHIVTVSDTEHNMSIFMIEEGQVRLKVDAQVSEWITEGQNYNFRDGVIIVVKEILFQSYSGGKRQVGYVVG